MSGFIKLMDTPECDMLLEKYPDAFILMTLIAKKARRDNNLVLMGLSKGQAFLGNNRYGMTESGFRNAKRKLVKFGLASFKSTRKGIVATILDTRVYDINAEPENERITEQKQAEDHVPGNSPLNPEPTEIDVRPEPEPELSDLNDMFKEKVIEPLRGGMPVRYWETYIKPLVIKSVDKEKNMAVLYHGTQDSWVNEHFKNRIEKNLGMSVRFEMGDG